MAARRKVTTTQESVSVIGKEQFKTVQEAIKALDKLIGIPDVVDKIKVNVEEIKENYAYGLQEKEVEIREKQQQLDQDFVKYEQSLQEKKEGLRQALADAQTKHQRDLETVDYEHGIAVRNKDLETAIAIGELHHMDLVETSDWNKVKDTVRLNEEDLKSVETEAIQKTAAKLTNQHERETSDLRHEYDMEIALAKKDIQSLNNEVQKVRSENDKLQSMLETQNTNIVQIAEAATRPSVVHENTSSKK